MSHSVIPTDNTTRVGLMLADVIGGEPALNQFANRLLLSSSNHNGWNALIPRDLLNLNKNC